MSASSCERLTLTKMSHTRMCTISSCSCSSCTLAMAPATMFATTSLSCRSSCCALILAMLASSFRSMRLSPGALPKHCDACVCPALRWLGHYLTALQRSSSAHVCLCGTQAPGTHQCGHRCNSRLNSNSNCRCNSCCFRCCFWYVCSRMAKSDTVNVTGKNNMGFGTEVLKKHGILFSRLRLWMSRSTWEAFTAFS